MNLLLYGFLALTILGTLGGIGYKVRQGGYDACKVEWQAANSKATADAEAERKRQDAVRQAADEAATKRLANEKKRAATIMASLEAHIRASGSAAKCPVPPGVLDAWNAANAGPESVSPGSVPDASRGATHTH